MFGVIVAVPTDRGRAMQLNAGLLATLLSRIAFHIDTHRVRTVQEIKSRYCANGRSNGDWTRSQSTVIKV
jgi:hypothetical protein